VTRAVIIAGLSVTYFEMIIGVVVILLLGFDLLTLSGWSFAPHQHPIFLTAGNLLR
jgi:hypothetical protein